MHVKIKRKTRSDIVISNEEELVQAIKKKWKNFKRLTSTNSFIIDSLKPEYSSIVEFNTHLKEILGTKSGMHPERLFESFGYNDEEREEHSNKLAQRTVKFLENNGISKTDYYRSNSKLCVEYWLSRGFTETEANSEISKIQSKNSSKCSSETKKKNSPLSVEYYTSRGISEDIAKSLVSDIQKSRSKRCIEYWLERGYSKEESAKLVVQYQSGHMDGKTLEEKQEILKKRIPSINIKTLQTTEFKEPGIFYVIHLADNKYKIGITVRHTLRQRYGNAINGLEYRKYNLPTITEAYKIEQKIRKLYDRTISKRDYGSFGWTEVIESSGFDEIEQHFKVALNEIAERNKT